MKKVLVIMALLAMVGCSPLSDTTKKGDASAKANADLHGQVLKPSPVLGSNNTFQGAVTIGELPLTEIEIDSKLKTDIETSYSTETKICFGLMLFFLACSLAITAIFLPLLVGFLRQSKAIKATSTLLDTGIASAVNLASVATDNRTIADAHSARATLEGLKKHL